MLNTIILQGNIGRAPKIFLTQEGKEIASFSLATSTYWKDKSGEWQTSTDWHRITVFRESTIGWIKDLLKRGDKVYVEGKLTYQQWTDKYGQARLTPHIVVSRFEGKVKHLNSSQSSPRDNEPIPEKGQKPPSSLMENTDVCPSLDLPKEDALLTQPCPQTFSRKGEEKEQENSNHKGETTYEN